MELTALLTIVAAGSGFIIGTMYGFWRGQLCERARVATEQKVAPKGPAGERGQVGWMGGEHDK